MFDLKFQSPILALIVACLDFGFGRGNALAAPSTHAQNNHYALPSIITCIATARFCMKLALHGDVRPCACVDR